MHQLPDGQSVLQVSATFCVWNPNKNSNINFTAKKNLWRTQQLIGSIHYVYSKLCHYLDHISNIIVGFWIHGSGQDVKNFSNCYQKFGKLTLPFASSLEHISQASNFLPCPTRQNSTIKGCQWIHLRMYSSYFILVTGLGSIIGGKHNNSPSLGKQVSGYTSHPSPIHQTNPYFTLCSRGITSTGMVKAFTMSSRTIECINNIAAHVLALYPITSACLVVSFSICLTLKSNVSASLPRNCHQFLIHLILFSKGITCRQTSAFLLVLAFLELSLVFHTSLAHYHP